MYLRNDRIILVRVVRSQNTECRLLNQGEFMKIQHHTLGIATTAGAQFVDVTNQIAECVRLAGVNNGIVNVQTKHTTTAIVVNENEPLLMDDMKKTLERVAPSSATYRHDDFSIRSVNLEPHECRNGHSHCQALFLNASALLNIADGKMQLGRWQRIFFVELDGAKERTISIVIIGR
jgi:secondary thiamine-phosphate synthase enzyme